MNSLVRLGVSPASATPTGFHNQMFGGFPFSGTLGCLVRLAPQLFLLVYLHANVGHLVHQPQPYLQPSLPWLSVSAPPTGLDECCFNSLVVRLLYSSIFWQFWLVFVCKFVVVLLVVRGGAVCLPTPPFWLEVQGFFSLSFINFTDAR